MSHRDVTPRGTMTCHAPLEKTLGLELGFQETGHNTVGRPDPPMCCNIIFHVPVPRGVEPSNLGHSRGA
eukprot:3275752-Pyramimonas_sp.AAC.1